MTYRVYMQRTGWKRQVAETSTAESALTVAALLIGSLAGFYGLPPRDPKWIQKNPQEVYRFLVEDEVGEIIGWVGDPL